MPSAFSWPMSVPSSLRLPAPVNQGVRPTIREAPVKIVHLIALVLVAIAAALLFSGSPKAAAGAFALCTAIELIASAMTGKKTNT